jgi:transposase-like protein
VVTVEADVDAVERRLAAGELSCPACSSVLAGWGRARPRQLRGPDGPVELCPRRSRCTGCRATHVLLPVSALLRRADAAAVIVSALAAKAVRRVGFRAIAAELARPAETVRGWLRRFAERAEAVRSVFTVWLRAVDSDPVMPDSAGGVFADAVTVIAAVAATVRGRFSLPEVSLAETAVAVSGGRLLAPGWPGQWMQHESTLPPRQM